MKTVVIYKSATGFTKKYAEWIAEELSSDIFAFSEITLQKMMDYDCIVFGGRVHADGIDGISLIKRNLEKLKGKRLIVFATGAAPADESRRDLVRNKNLTPQQQANIQLFYLRGGFNFATLPFIDKILMFFYNKMLIRKQRQGKQLTSDEAGMLELMNKAEDFTKKENIQDIVQAVRMELQK